MRIGELAAQAGVTVPTVRFYERRGLLPGPAPEESGYRSYSADAVRVVRFVRQAQELGFTLSEIDGLLSLANDGPKRCQDVGSLARAKIESVDLRIERLSVMRWALLEQVEACERPDPDTECPFLEPLESV